MAAGSLRVGNYDEGVLGCGGGERNGDFLSSGGASRKGGDGGYFVAPMVAPMVDGGEGKGGLGAVLCSIDVADFSPV